MNGDRPRGSEHNAPGTDWLLSGRYRLTSQVGAGGMAVVWQAYDNVLARTVAVKVLAAHYAGDPQSRDRIRREARAAAVLSHPNIAQVYDYGEAAVSGEVIPYVVMELIHGRTLQQRLHDGPLLPGYTMRVCAEIAAALAAAHSEGIVHRDIKPANVMLAATGAKVVDFGIADAIRPAGPGTDDFEVLGTPAYLAPERLLHDAVEPASDVYALGVLLYRLLAGRSPWTSETTTQMLAAHVYAEPAPLEPMVQVPDYVTALCNRCLAKDPAARPSAREAGALLAHGAGLRVITDEQPPDLRTGTDSEPSVLIRAAADPGHAFPGAAARRRWATYTLVAVAVLAGFAATLWLTRPASREAAAPGVDSTAEASRAAVHPLPGASTPATTSPAEPAAGPATVNTSGAPAPGPAGTGPATAAPEPTVAPTPTPAEENERTLSSVAGSVRAGCPASDTAQILSWTAVKPYKVTQGDKIAGPSPEVSFKHGNRLVTMTVTCTGGIPSATIT